MSAPPDPNQLLKLLLEQQRQQRQQQQQQQQQVFNHQPPPQQQQQSQYQAPMPQAHHQGPGPPVNSGAVNLLGNLVADFLKASPGAAVPAAGPSPAAAMLNTQTSSLAPIAPNPAPTAGNEQQLLALSKLLASVNPSMSSQNQQGHQHHQQQNTNQSQTSQQQFQQWGGPPQQQYTQIQPQYQPRNPPPQQQHQTNQVQQSFLSSSPEGGPGAPDNPRLPMVNNNNNGTSVPSQPTLTVSKSTVRNNDTSTTTKKPPTAAHRTPPEPVSLLTLQTWNLQQLEAHARSLEECHQTVPQIVKILLDDARQREEKRRAKRISNRKSATVSRARKRKLIDELTADNAKLRRQALILSYLPDPVIAISLDGTMKFCNVQLTRVLKHDIEDLEGANIRDILVPESRGAIRRLIQDLVRVEQVAASGGVNDSGSDGNGSSDQSFAVLEVNVNDQDEIGTGEENVSDSSGSGGKGGKDTFSSKEPPIKKSKTTANEVVFSSHCKTSGAMNMNVDDVMGASVTANNAGAKLSSLMHLPEKEKPEGNRKRPPEEMNQQDEGAHIHRKHILASRKMPQKQDSQSSSSTESDTRPGVNSSEDSGYKEDTNSNESSDDFAEDSSSLSRNSMMMKGNSPRPLAPGCIVGFICTDLTTMWCEITSCIRTRTNNDEDEDLGIVDINPKPTEKGLDDDEPQAEKELLLCLRPIMKGDKVEEDLRFPNQVSESSNPTESGGSTVVKSSSGSEGKEASDLDADGHVSKTESLITKRAKFEETKCDAKNGDMDSSSNGGASQDQRSCNQEKEG